MKKMNFEKIELDLNLNKDTTLKWHSFGKHWNYKIHSRTQNFIMLISPTLHDAYIKNSKLNLTQKKEILTEFIELENFILKQGYKGWISWTTINLPHIMIIMSKVGARPYFIDAKTGDIYFKKYLNAKSEKPK